MRLESTVKFVKLHVRRVAHVQGNVKTRARKLVRLNGIDLGSNLRQ